MTPYKNKSLHKSYINYKLTKNCNNIQNLVTNLITLALNLSTLHAERKPINAYPGLKVGQNLYETSIQILAYHGKA